MKLRRRLKFNRIHFKNRWTERYPSDRWTIIGIHRSYYHSDDACFSFHLFGLEMYVWFKEVLTRKSQKFVDADIKRVNENLFI